MKQCTVSIVDPDGQTHTIEVADAKELLDSILGKVRADNVLAEMAAAAVRVPPTTTMHGSR